jgi:hypothetical protein
MSRRQTLLWDYFLLARHPGTIATLLAGSDTNWLDKKHK